MHNDKVQFSASPEWTDLGVLGLKNAKVQVTFRKKIYETIDALQKDLDEWLHYYNNKRTHQGKMCFSRTRMQTFIDGKQLLKKKFLKQIWPDRHFWKTENCQNRFEPIQFNISAETSGIT